MAHAAAGHRVVPRSLHVGRLVDPALALAGARHHRLDDARIADRRLARRAGAVDGGLQLLQRVAEDVGAGRQAQRLGGEAADALSIHGQARGAGGRDDAHDTLGLECLQLGRRDGLDLGDDEVGLLALDQRAQRGAVAHGDRARVVRDLLAGRVLVAVDGDGLDAQALQRDQHFLAELAASKQHHARGRRAERRAEGFRVRHGAILRSGC